MKSNDQVLKMQNIRGIMAAKTLLRRREARRQGLYPKKEKVAINVGGKLFETYRDTLKKIPDTRLASLNQMDEGYESEKGIYFFDRNPELFPSILDYYRTGELHFPPNQCGRVVKNELEYWGIDDNLISRCCWRRYQEYKEEIEKMDIIEKAFNWSSGMEPDEDNSSVTITPWWTIRHKIWVFLEDPNSSTTAKLWAFLMYIFIIASVVLACLDTEPFFRVDAVTPGNITGINNTRHIMFATTDTHSAIVVADILMNAFFTVEVILKMVTTPSVRIFLRMLTSINDIINIICTWVIWIIFFTIGKNHNTTIQDIVFFLSMLRVLRVFRMLNLAKQYRALHVLLLAIRSSFKELFLLIALISMGMVVFACLMYYIEINYETSDFISIPFGFWWSIITMTTVGYGDVHPQTPLGYMVGAVCAICGLICTGLPIPIIGHKFNQYYQCAHLEQSLKTQQKKGNYREYVDSSDDMFSSTGSLSLPQIIQVAPPPNKRKRSKSSGSLAKKVHLKPRKYSASAGENSTLQVSKGIKRANMPLISIVNSSFESLRDQETRQGALSRASEVTETTLINFKDSPSKKKQVSTDKDKNDTLDANENAIKKFVGTGSPKNLKGNQVKKTIGLVKDKILSKSTNRLRKISNGSRGSRKITPPSPRNNKISSELLVNNSPSSIKSQPNGPNSSSGTSHKPISRSDSAGYVSGGDDASVLTQNAQNSSNELFPPKTLHNDERMDSALKKPNIELKSWNVIRTDSPVPMSTKSSPCSSRSSSISLVSSHVVCNESEEVPKLVVNSMSAQNA
ncbi:unnamed protein product [Owenia fusiformis]|uniref:BTB domain-containing protein n=1 Tax=Owenia fusiformis TaxID=6347 RepID=A0A8S4QBE1_OWEFU|nr:unnamed protein product [Owenia fusiformis]